MQVNFCVAATCENWLLYKRRRPPQGPPSKELFFYLYNPTSKEHIVLPMLIIPLDLYDEESKISSKCILTAPPTTSQSFVCFFLKRVPLVMFCRPRDREWTGYRYGRNGEVRLYDVILCREKVYALHSSIGLRRLEFEPESSFNYEAPLPVNNNALAKELQLVVDSFGNLFVVLIKSITQIDMFQMDFDRNRWERVYDLGPGTCFFLSGGYSESMFSVVDPAFGIRRNAIYFTHDADDQTLYSFCFADKSLSFWRNHSDSGTLCISPDEMMPSLRLSDKPRSCPMKSIKQLRQDDSGDENNVNECRWLQLPESLQILILQRLPTLVDQMNCRAACRYWRSLIHPIHWKVNEVPYKYPWLMFPQGDDKGVVYNLYDPITNLMHILNVPELEGCRVRFSNRGWLLVTEPPYSIFFFEPFSGRKIRLPNLRPLDEDIDAFCFSGTPTSPNWQILATRHVRNVTHALYYRQGQQWTRLTLNITPDNCFTNVVFDRNCFRYLRKDGSFICFKFDDEDERLIDWRLKCSASHLLKDSRRRFLTCYEDELILVFFDKTRCIHMAKLDRMNARWVPINRMEKEIVYMSQTTSLVVEAEEQYINDNVQLPMVLDQQGSSNISYHLKDHIYKVYKRDDHDHQGYSQIENLYHTREFTSATWIQPLLLPSFQFI